MPPWMTEYIKPTCDNIYKSYLRSTKNNQDFQCLQSAIDDASNIICKRLLVMWLLQSVCAEIDWFNYKL